MSSSGESGDESAYDDIRVTPVASSESGSIERLGTRRGARQYLVVDHSANQRSGAVISSIWRHGGERRRLDDSSMSRYWRCGHCKGATVLKVAETGGGQTSYATRHLKNKHHINIKEDEAVISPSPSLFLGIVDLTGTTVASIATKGYKALVSTVDIQRFYNALVMFFIICNIVFSIIESSYY
jgi:hypothetical protein